MQSIAIREEVNYEVPKYALVKHSETIVANVLLVPEYESATARWEDEEETIYGPHIFIFWIRAKRVGVVIVEDRTQETDGSPQVLALVADHLTKKVYVVDKLTAPIELAQEETYKARMLATHVHNLYRINKWRIFKATGRIYMSLKGKDNTTPIPTLYITDDVTGKARLWIGESIQHKPTLVRKETEKDRWLIIEEELQYHNSNIELSYWTVNTVNKQNKKKTTFGHIFTAIIKNFRTKHYKLDLAFTIGFADPERNYRDSRHVWLVLGAQLQKQNKTTRYELYAIDDKVVAR